MEALTVVRKKVIAAAWFLAVSTFGQHETDLVAKYKSELSRNPRIYFHQHDYQSAANEFREALNADLQPGWLEVWAHIGLGKIFDTTGQRERAINEYRQAQRTKDNTRGALDDAELYLATPYPRSPQKVH
jgi:Tfp pilus assembly protein PilF